MYNPVIMPSLFYIKFYRKIFIFKKFHYIYNRYNSVFLLVLIVEENLFYQNDFFTISKKLVLDFRLSKTYFCIFAEYCLKIALEIFFIKIRNKSINGFLMYIVLSKPKKVKLLNKNKSIKNLFIVLFL